MTMQARPIVCATCGAYVFGNRDRTDTSVPQHQPHKPGCKQADALWPRFKYVK